MAREFRVEVMMLAVVLAACSDDGADPASAVSPAPPGAPHESLAEWNLFTDGAKQLPNERVIAYDVISPLYSDYTFKRRFLWIPDGTTIGYVDDAPWTFPDGTIMVKSFSYLSDYRDPAVGERLLETRLLVNEPGGWEAHTYVWSDDQAQAIREVAGDIITLEWIDLAGDAQTNDYIVPNTNECQDCHGEKPVQVPLGPRTRQLDRDGQLEQLDELGLLSGSPATERTTLVDPFGDASESERVRSYFDSNCGHCHTEGGTASDSALLLSYEFTDPAVDSASNWGVCKVPTSAGGATCGRTFDGVPGDPEASIIMCRLESGDPEVRMPPLVSRFPHAEGNELVRMWIENMEPSGCDSSGN